ncbi:nucleotidyl transferase AbiEii/AbiGii toxin family protein [Paraburkholderia sp. HP33-1]|uniref:nucleotidyl transferase AbiEii/AbiGii toxin family protein n=1 Tax=Paraburkholderia sp. HP33-1 TaxID=2883243 RepID=UPI001F26C30F|nr:nucleotidyl transferase AbiEii/AbiGii toxin family protein [Paraburkholderia sp. HP33-1]
MTNTSQPSRLEISVERPLSAETHALLRYVRDVAAQLDTGFVVAGATARDLVLWHVYGIRAERATRDVDVAVCAVSWEAHDKLVALLLATGRFAAHKEKRHSLNFHDPDVGAAVPLDLVPFGDVEAPAGEIAWPPRGEFVMNVLGFREAVDTAINIDIGDGLVVPVVSLPALALLKLLAWHDRRTRKNTDASDLLLVIRHYLRAGNEERIWTIASDLLEAHGFDLDLAAATLLGRETRAIALSATVDAVTPLLTDEGTYDTLRRDVLARAAAQLLEDFADSSDRILAAFRDGFLSPQSGAV